MMKSLGGLLVAVLLVVLSAPALAQTSNGELLDVDVMSQNLYIGADLNRILQGEPPAAVLETALATNYSGRAVEIAKTIGAERPDLVGLQEATLIVISTVGQEPVVIDYLAILVGQLNAQGYSYAVSSELINADVTLPISVDEAGFPVTVARVVDRDAIIHNTETTTVANPAGQNFSTNFTFELGGFPVEFTRGYTKVDATVAGKTFRFVNTHLEVENAPCSTPEGPVICQDAQATELIDTLSSTWRPTILVGDFNAVPGDNAYQIVKRGGYADTWTTENENERAKGYTCCQSELLDNEISELDRRIDHIFVWRRGGAELEKAVTTVLGDDRVDVPVGVLWSSDHGAPFGRLLLEFDH